jgi:hypothetical protein
MKFFKGCMIATPIALAMWAVIILVIYLLVHLIGG